MISKKEKIVVKILGQLGSDNRVFGDDDIIQNSEGKISAPDLAQLLNYKNHSEYFERPGAATSQIKLTLKGRAYLQNYKFSLIKEWIVIIASVVAALTGIIALISNGWY